MNPFENAVVSFCAVFLALACSADDAAPAGGSGGANAAGVGGAGAAATGGSSGGSLGGQAGASDSAASGAAGSQVLESGLAYAGGADGGDVETSVTDADASAPNGCPDAEAKARYAACKVSTDEQSCVTNGGKWFVAYCLERTCTVCDCPQLVAGAGCACEHAIECYPAYCTWKPSNSALSLDLIACEAAAAGTCGVSSDLNAWFEITSPGACTLHPAKDQ
jgi:hypothetical protein